MVVTRNRLSCERSKNRRNVSHQASTLGITVRKRHLPSCQEKERQARSKRGLWRKVGVVKIAAVIIWEWASGKSCLAWRESRECNAVYLCRSRVLYFPPFCNVFVRLKRGRDWCTEPSSGEKGKKRRELGFGRPQCSCHQSKWNNYQLLRLDAPSAMIIYNGIKGEDVISWKGFL